MIKRVTLPAQSPQETENTIMLEAGNFIPEELDNVNLDYQVIGTRTESKEMEVLLAAAKKDIVSSYAETLRGAGLLPVVVDVDYFALDNLYELNYDPVADQVVDHTVELGVLSFRPENPLLQSIVVFSDELVFVVPPAHPLAKAKSVSIRQLGAESFVAHNVVSPYRLKVLETFKRHKTPLNIGVEMPTIESIKLFVAAGNGVALVPGITVEPELKRGELVSIPVKELKLERKLRIVYRRGGELSHAARAFLQVAESISSDAKGRYLYQPER
jgi:hypothetical protein